MKYIAMPGAAPSAAAFAAATPAGAGQVPGSLAAADIPVSHRDRVYSSDQFSNTVSIIDPAANRLVGVIRLGEPAPANFSPMWAFNPETDVAFRWWRAIAVGSLPHGIRPSGDGTRVYVGLENGDAMTAIDTLTNKVIATVPVGQAPQAVAYVPDAVPDGDGTANTLPPAGAGEATHVTLVPVGGAEAGHGAAPTSVALFDQGLLQVLQAAVTGLQAGQPYFPGLSDHADGSGRIRASRASRPTRRVAL